MLGGSACHCRTCILVNNEDMKTTWVSLSIFAFFETSPVNLMGNVELSTPRLWWFWLFIPRDCVVQLASHESMLCVTSNWDYLSILEKLTCLQYSESICSFLVIFSSIQLVYVYLFPKQRQFQTGKCPSPAPPLSQGFSKDHVPWCSLDNLLFIALWVFLI